MGIPAIPFQQLDKFGASRLYFWPIYWTYSFQANRFKLVEWLDFRTRLRHSFLENCFRFQLFKARQERIGFSLLQRIEALSTLKIGSIPASLQPCQLYCWDSRSYINGFASPENCISASASLHPTFLDPLFSSRQLWRVPIERISDGFHYIPCPCGTCVSIMFFQQVIRLEEMLYEDFEIK